MWVHNVLIRYQAIYLSYHSATDPSNVIEIQYGQHVIRGNFTLVCLMILTLKSCEIVR